MASFHRIVSLMLLRLWGEKSVHTTLEGCTRNKSIYDKIAAELTLSGYTYVRMVIFVFL